MQTDLFDINDYEIQRIWGVFALELPQFIFPVFSVSFSTEEPY